MIYLIVAIGFIIDIIFIVHDDAKHDALSIGLKTLASAVFVGLAAYLSFSVKESLVDNYILYALIADLVGDFILILRNIDNKHSDLILYLGTIAFLIGHIFLAILLIMSCPNVILRSTIVSTILFLIVGVYLLVTLKLSTSKKIAGGIYLYTVLFVLGYSFCAYMETKSSFDSAFLFGYFLFAVSDVILMIQKFSENPSPTLQPIYRLSYFVSQILIALSIMYL